MALAADKSYTYRMLLIRTSISPYIVGDPIQINLNWEAVVNPPERNRTTAADIGSDRGAEGPNLSSRRDFLTRIPGAAGLGLASVGIASGSPAEAAPQDLSIAAATKRAIDAFQIRLEAAQAEADVAVPRQITNGDESRYPNFIANFSKGLPHNDLGEVNPNVYRAYLGALQRGTAKAFEDLQLGGNVKLVNPLAGLAFELEGTDSHQLTIPPFPALPSREAADETLTIAPPSPPARVDMRLMASRLAISVPTTLTAMTRSIL